MKKVAFFLLIILIFCLSSCGEDKSSKTSEDSSSDVVLKQDKESSVEDASSTIEEKSEEISEDPSTLPSYFLLSKIETKVSSGTNKTEMKYNEDGLIIENVSYAKGKLSTKYTYEYNDNGILIVEAHYAYDNSGNVFYYTKNTYSHDEDGVLKSCELDENGDLYTISYEYDSKGRLSSSQKSNKDGEIILRTEYNYLENNEGYTKINYTPDGLQKEVYDKNENMIEYSFENSSGVVTSNTILEYDDYNNIIKSTNNKGVITEFKNTYENNLLISIKTFVDGEETEMTEYKYDKYGNCIKEKVSSATGTVKREITNTWTPVYSEGGALWSLLKKHAYCKIKLRRKVL